MLDTDLPKTQEVPLRIDDHGTVRVGQTRVALSSVVTLFDEGESAAGIVEEFDTLKLADVYAVVSYYLRHRGEVKQQIEREDSAGEALRKKTEAEFPSSALRERLLRRKPALGPGEA